jgi:DNA-binding beta-propeller fold protein YncE
VVDASTNRVVRKIPVGNDVGNTRFDPGTGRILVAVGSSNELVAIDPQRLSVVGRYALPGVKGAHGVAIDPSTRTAFIAGEQNASVGAFSLSDCTLTAVATVGEEVDVLDVDPQTHRLFVASESGVVSIFDISGGGLKKLEEGFFAQDAHVVGVDRVTHLLYFPLQDIGGRPVLRIARYTGR